MPPAEEGALAPRGGAGQAGGTGRNLRLLWPSYGPCFSQSHRGLFQPLWGEGRYHGNFEESWRTEHWKPKFVRRLGDYQTSLKPVCDLEPMN